MRTQTPAPYVFNEWLDNRAVKGFTYLIDPVNVEICNPHVCFHGPKKGQCKQAMLESNEPHLCRVLRAEVLRFMQNSGCCSYRRIRGGSRRTAAW
jgi:hypothetical protein